MLQIAVDIGAQCVLFNDGVRGLWSDSAGTINRQILSDPLFKF